MRSVVCWSRESGIACWCRILLGESWRHDKTWRGTPILNPFRTHTILFCTEKPRIQLHITDREYSEHFKAESGEKCTLYWIEIEKLEQRISDKIRVFKGRNVTSVTLSLSLSDLTVTIIIPLYPLTENSLPDFSNHPQKPWLFFRLDDSFKSALFPT